MDIKGGTVLIWMMLRVMQEQMPEVFDNVDWLIAANASEEVMAVDFAHRTTERCPSGAAAVLVFEGGPILAGEYHLVTARKGRAEYRITAEGRAAHAGSAHHEGINAIVALTSAVKAVAELTDHGIADVHAAVTVGESIEIASLAGPSGVVIGGQPVHRAIVPLLILLAVSAWACGPRPPTPSTWTAKARSS